MTTQEFIKEFNSGDVNRRATVYRRQNLKEADINLAIPFPPNDRIDAIIFCGYLKLSAAVWYAVMKDGNRIPIKAFEMFADGLRTYNEWVKTAPPKLAPLIKSKFVEAFNLHTASLEWNN